MTDGDEDMVPLITGRGDGEQRSDGPALHHLEPVVDQAPLDVLGVAEVRFDPPAKLGEPHDLRIGQCWLLLPRWLDGQLLRSARRRGADLEQFRADRLGGNFTAPHLVDVGVHQAGHQGLPEAEAGLDGDDLPVRGDRVGREEGAGHLREDHLLHDHRHVDLPVAEAVPQPVRHGPLGEQRRPATADVLEDRSRPHDVQVGVLLTREGCRRQVLRRRAGSDGVGSMCAKPGDRADDRRHQAVRDGDLLNGLADLRTECADRLLVVGVQPLQSAELVVGPRRR